MFVTTLAQHKTYTPSYYKLAIQWPNAVCNQHEYVLGSCKRPIPQRFTIHGLWGFVEDHKAIPHCKGGDELQAFEVDHKKDQLKQEWPNLVGDDFQLWFEQWRKHGRCINDMTVVEKYFNTALDAMGEVGPLVELLLDGIGLEPAGDDCYIKTQDIPSAIEKQLNKIVEVKCNKNKDGKSQIHEVYFCVSVQGKLADCAHDSKRRPPYTTTSCPNDILYPSDPSPPMPPAAPMIPAFLSHTFYLALTTFVFYVFYGFI
ncbi:hypothetical protein RHGRI_028444 [Rhododendron griersonianum]|uniref:Uncharacterized protein n=1 Tax=Rhododendron griersonianum TaxID=479676 RepID=A0AAV6ILT4_9ERIC|nr:hypothetical protein RHGRI_028444 [Rhododendron griersonianum]